ncbi:MAG: type IV secretory system conjugative DNA transfer family protein [Oscillospiraceae bacterium]|nr:type IV secretory system conjugative DNA transfer family protein [Oscillospiraceae bacterium]
MEYKLGKYQNLNQETRWASAEEVKRSSTYVDLHGDTYPTAGLPILSDGHEAYVDGEDTHTLIFGSTGSKKTRLFCMPLLNMFIRAGESFIATDPKGELYARSAGHAKAMGYRTVVLNFRDIGKGDMWNPLSLPYRLYHSGKIDEAVGMLNDFVRTIAAPQFENTKDVFWPEMASSFALANLLLLMEAATEEEANVTSLAALCSNAASKKLSVLTSNMRTDTIAGLNYQNIFTSAEKTLQSILVSLFGMIRIFTTQRNLNNMLSGNTVDISEFGREKTAVYLIIPDEKSTYHFLITTFIKQAYEILIAEAQKEENRQMPVRVNFVLDEFCNLPRIPDMPSMISAARSRNMRYYLVAQSLHQLKGRYGEEADTIKGNCDNWVFLTSKELTLLEEISRLCGSYRTPGGSQRNLISISELQRLDKAKGEALIMHARQYPTISEIADIDTYSMFKGYETPPLQDYEMPEAKMFDLNGFYREVINGSRPLPFS